MNGETQILVVEDNPRDQELIQREFGKRNDCTLWVVFTAQEAIECLLHKKFHLVLLDLNMPAMRENGLWVLEEIRKHKLKIPVVVISGVDNGPAVEAAKQHPILTLIQKPLDQEKINQLLEDFWP